jgi:hypothetical protein
MAKESNEEMTEEHEDALGIQLDYDSSRLTLEKRWIIFMNR